MGRDEGGWRGGAVRQRDGDTGEGDTGDGGHWGWGAHRLGGQQECGWGTIGLAPLGLWGHHWDTSVGGTLGTPGHGDQGSEAGDTGADGGLGTPGLRPVGQAGLERAGSEVVAGRGEKGQRGGWQVLGVPSLWCWTRWRRGPFTLPGPRWCHRGFLIREGAGKFPDAVSPVSPPAAGDQAGLVTQRGLGTVGRMSPSPHPPAAR